MGDKKKVLIIEDNEQNRKLEKDLLEVSGYEVIMAEEAESGIKLAFEHSPDLILMDLRMPGMSGQEAYKILKNDDRTRNIPCIAVSASVLQDIVDKILEKGFTGFIFKPINTRTFVEEIEKCLNG